MCKRKPKHFTNTDKHKILNTIDCICVAVCFMTMFFLFDIVLNVFQLIYFWLLRSSPLKHQRTNISQHNAITMSRAIPNSAWRQKIFTTHILCDSTRVYVLDGMWDNAHTQWRQKKSGSAAFLLFVCACVFWGVH